MCLADLSTSETVTREYFHEKQLGEPSRKRRCVKRFTDKRAAANERSGLEIHCALPSTGRRGQYHPN
jgi:hypothetical protein